MFNAVSERACLILKANGQNKVVQQLSVLGMFLA